MQNLDIINKIIDTKDFTTGGGSASAIAGAMAGGLAGMVARLSISKEWGLDVQEYEEIANDMDILCIKLLEGAVEDSNAYMLIKNAYSLPKETEEQIIIRKEEIQRAGIKAASAPLKNAKMCRKIYDICLKLKDKSNANAYSDLAEAEMLSHSGLMGCILNIEANLPLIKDEEIKSEFKEMAECLKGDCKYNK